FTADQPGETHTELSAIPTTTDANGQIAFRVKDPTAETGVVVTATLSGTGNNIGGTNPQTLTFIATAPCVDPAADHCSKASKIWADAIDVAPVTVTANGSAEHIVTVHAYDKSGGDLGGQAVVWSCGPNPGSLTALSGSACGGLTVLGSADSTTAADGTAKLRLATTAAGDYQVTATLAGQTLTDAHNAVANQHVPVQISYGAGAVDASKSSFDVLGRATGDIPVVSDLSGVPASGDTDYWIVRVTAKDADDNHIQDLAAVQAAVQFGYLAKSEFPGKTVEFSAIQKVAAGSLPVGYSGPETAKGYTTYIAYARTTTATEWSLTAKASGSDIGSAIPKSWKAGAVDPDQSAYTLDNSGVVTADGNSPRNAVITAKDAFGNTVGGVKVKIANQTSGDDPTALVIGPNSNGEGSTAAGTGQASFTLKSTAAKTYSIKAWVDVSTDSTPDWAAIPDAQSPDGNPAPATFSAGECSAAHSVLKVDRDEQTVGGDVAVTIALRDANGNACASASAPTLEATPATPRTLTSPAGGSGGIYTATLSDQKAETVQLSAKVGQTTISNKQIGSADETAGTPIPVKFTTDEPATNCTPPGGSAQPASKLELDNGDDASTTGGSHQITATVKDKYCNPVVGWTVDFAYASPLEHEADSGYATDDNGQAWVKVKSAVASNGADDYLVTAAVTKDADGEDASFNIANDNDPTGTGGSTSDGKVFAKFGADTVDVAKSSFDVACDSPLTADGTQACTVTATLKDSAGNAVAGKAGSLTLSVTPATGVTPATATFTQSGSGASTVYVASFASTKAEVKTIGVTQGGQTIKYQTPDTGSATTTRTFVAGPPNQAKSSFAVTNLAKVANGSDEQTATLTVKDANDNPVAGVACDFAATPAVSAPFTFAIDKPSPAQTDADGVCAATIKTTKAGTYAVTGSYTAGTAVAFGPLDTTFSPGVPDTTASKLELNGAASATSTVNTPITATATVVDAFGNPIEGATVYFQVSAGQGDATHTATVDGLTQTAKQTNALGVAAAPVNSTKADTYQVYAALNGQHQASGADIAQSPAAATFTAGEPVAANSSIAVDSATAVPADGSGEHTVTVTLKDQYLNPVADKPVAFSLPSGLDLKASSANPATTAANGQAVITVTSNYSTAPGGVYSGTPPKASFPVTATWNGEAITTGSPAVANYSVDGASAAKSTLTMARYSGAHNPVTVDDVPGYTARVLVKNGSDQIVPGAEVVFTLDNQALFGNGQTTQTVQANSEGVAEATLYSHKLASGAETTLTATIGGVAVQGSPEHPTFAVGAPFAGQNASNGDPASRVAITAGTVTADGVAAHTATVYAVDYYGNKVPNAKVKLFQTDADGATAYSGATPVTISDGGAGQTDANGNTTFTIKSTTAGTFFLRAEVVKDQYIAAPTAADYQVAYNSPVQAVFGAGAGSAEQSTLVLEPKVAGTPPLQVGTADANTYLATVTVKDANGNLVGAGQSVVFTVTGATSADDATGISLAGVAQTTHTAATGADGKAQVAITSIRPGNFSVRADVAGQEVGSGANGDGSSPQAATWTTDGVPADPAHSEIVYESTTSLTTAENPDGILVTVTLRDAYGNPLGNRLAPTTTLALAGGGAASAELV
ncbi:MAG: Ig-like domain-containing protein, partial [Propionibacteriaceae bacterium]|nr:Ig-like domain-containing protein [Propionibacteriaceae bacterium]